MSNRYDILVIEDEKIVIDSIKKILVPEGFTIDDTYNVEIAIQNLEKNKYKLIITDLMLHLSCSSIYFNWNIINLMIK